MRTNLKPLLLPLCLLALAGSQCALLRSTHEPHWCNSFDGNLLEEVLCVRETDDGGYILGGRTTPASGGIFSDMYLAKTDPQGDMLWQRSFTYPTFGSHFAVATYVQQTDDHDYMVGGFTTNFGYPEMYLVKADAQGNRLWERTFRGCGRASAYSAQQTCDGGYVLAGSTGFTGVRECDVYLVKTDERGNVLWQRVFGGKRSDWALSVEQTDDDGYILTGGTESFDGGDGDMYLVKTDAKGNVLWQRTFGGKNQDCAHSVHQTDDGGYILAGVTKSLGAGSFDMYLVKTDKRGNLLWEATYGGQGEDVATSVQETDDGGYILAGGTESSGAGGSDMYLVRTDADGALLWQRTFGGEYEDGAHSVRQTHDGGYVMVGETSSFETSVYMVRTDAGGNVLWEKNLGQNRAPLRR